ncbi:MAG: hypothetical protein IIW54_09915, partial [Lachnospiraceae bacterium]|nr:hypothetical protein [Lachnospiraceae bacterium]
MTEKAEKKIKNIDRAVKDDSHAKHRQRMYKRLKREGVAAFYDHELFEILLYFSIPRRNTNDIAHRLLKAFNSIEDIMNTDVAGLISVDGVGEKTAMLLNVIGELMRRAQAQRSACSIRRIK